MMFFQGISFMTISIKLLFVLIWTWILNLLCSKGLSVVSWILVLLPFVLIFFVVLLSWETIRVARKRGIVMTEDIDTTPYTLSKLQYK
jgi:type III secretory pathway component EscR